MKNTQRKKYESPSISRMEVEIEQGIATASALVVPKNDGNISYEYDQGEDDVRQFEW